jgi:hypothetical protein
MPDVQCGRPSVHCSSFPRSARPCCWKSSCTLTSQPIARRSLASASRQCLNWSVTAERRIRSPMLCCFCTETGLICKSCVYCSLQKKWKMNHRDTERQRLTRLRNWSSCVRPTSCFLQARIRQPVERLSIASRRRGSGSMTPSESLTQELFVEVFEPVQVNLQRPRLRLLAGLRAESSNAFPVLCGEANRIGQTTRITGGN